MRQIRLKPAYDLTIVGGGIQGCAMLWEAQSRGLKTLLVEQDDFCSQTSANSLKTIHGGIRYLQTLNLPRTWRSSKEPETLLKIAPHLVHPLSCLLPTEQSLKRSRLAVSLGFGFYNLIKQFSCREQRLPRARFITASHLKNITNRLQHTDITGAGLWYDAQVQHAERLGLAFVESAKQAGADAFNYLKATTLLDKPGQSLTLALEDQLETQSFQVSTRSIIYCSASATNENLSQQKTMAAQSATTPDFCLAVNLVANQCYADMAIGLQSGFASQSKSSAGRLLFSAPWRGVSLFGTWYFQLESGQLNGAVPTSEQIDFCLNDVNKSFPDLALSRRELLQVHGGLLPVDSNQQDLHNRLMEHDQISQPDNALSVFTVIPSKFTTCRVTAQKMIDVLFDSLGHAAKPSISAQTTLVGGEIGDYFGGFVSHCQQQYAHLLNDAVIEQLCVSYGSQIEEIIALCEANSSLCELIPGSTDHVKAQLEYELKHGGVFKADDFIRRRSFLGSNQKLTEHSVRYCCERINRFHCKQANIDDQVDKVLNITLY